MIGILACVIGVLWPAIVAALVVEWGRGLLAGDGGRRGSRRQERTTFEVRLSLRVSRTELHGRCVAADEDVAGP